MKSFFKSHPSVLVSLLMFAALAPLMMMRDFTPANELRYLSIADEAISNGNIFAFTNQGEAYADKPPLYFWIIMLSRLIFGSHSIFMLSLVSFIPALVIIGVMDRWMVLEADRSHRVMTFSDRFAAALMLGTSALFLGTSIFLRMDMLMCMFIVLALFSFYKMYTGTGNRKKHGILLPIYIFMALFTKGPVGLLLPPLAILVFLLSEGRIKEIWQYLGWKTWGIIAGLCALWFTGVLLDGGVSYLENLLFHQTVDRAVNAFHHKEPFWYYFVAIWYIVAPYSILLVYGFAGFFFLKGYRSVSGRLFSAIVLTAVLMLSSFSSKLSIYLLPVFPFLVYIFADMSGRIESKWPVKLSLAIPSVIILLAALTSIAVLAFGGNIPSLSVLLDRYHFAVSPFAYMAMSALVAGSAASLFFIFRDGLWQKPVISIAVSMLVCVLSASPLLPEANEYVGYGSLCKTAGQMASASGTDCKFITLYVFRSENMDVYLGEDVVDFGRDEDKYLESEPGPHILMIKSSHIGNGELSDRLSSLQYRESGEYRCYFVE